MQGLQNPLTVTFIDFMKAFDSVHHPLFWYILHAYGIPNKAVHTIQQLHTQSKCCVHTEDGQSDWFDIVTGFHQGCILSTLLFALGINGVLRTAVPGCDMKWTNGMKLSDRDFAEDITTFADDSQGLQALINNITSLAKCISLSINAKKKKNMVKGSFSNNNTSILINHEKVE